MTTVEDERAVTWKAPVVVDPVTPEPVRFAPSGLGVQHAVLY